MNGHAVSLTNPTSEVEDQSHVCCRLAAERAASGHPAAGASHAAQPASRNGLRGRVKRWFSSPRSRSRLSALWAPVGFLTLLLTLLVGAEVFERRFLPDLSIGGHHAILTIQACLATAGVVGTIYLALRHEHAQLKRTATTLTRALESYRSTQSFPARFDNPHLKNCREVLDCRQEDCPMHDLPGERCWQVMALRRSAYGHTTVIDELKKCLSCEVYRQSCPDALTELGESFNNLMFLLEEESRKVGAMRAHLVEKEKMVAIGQIASGIAHEIGNPLSSISSVVQMLKRAHSPALKTEQLDLIETHIQRISAIVRQLVTLARPAPAKWELVDLGQVLDEAIRLIRFDRRARNVEISLDRPSTLPRSHGIANELQQVFINLALNALDAMPEGGKLKLRAVNRGRQLVLHVEDTGSGILPEVGRRVFEPFFTTKEPGAGTGLGLAVSYGIVQKHGGTIGFESVPGDGTTFTVQLPILDGPPET